MRTDNTRLFCTCSSPQGAVGVFAAGESKYGYEIWVCVECLKPAPMYYDHFVEDCEDCGRSFSSPFESLCSFCVRGGSPERPARNFYRGWKWAADLHKQEQESWAVPLHPVV